MAGTQEEVATMTLAEQVKDIFAKRGLIVEERQPKYPQYHEPDSVLIYGYLDDYHWLVVVLNETANKHSDLMLQSIHDRMEAYLSRPTIFAWQSSDYAHRIEFINGKYLVRSE